MRRVGSRSGWVSAAAFVAAFCFLTGTGTAAVVKEHLARYTGAEVTRKGGAVSIEPRAVAQLPAGDALRAAWERFQAENPGTWNIYVDERTGMPTIASGSGMRWIEPGTTVTLADLESRARAFLDRHRFLFGEWKGTFELDATASRERRPGVFLLVFRQVVGGVRVEESRFDFHVNGGNLVAFGTHRWGRLTTDATPVLSATQAQTIIENHIGYDGSVAHEEVAPPQLTILALDPRLEEGLPLWRGARGAGIAHRLAWRVQFRVPGEVPLWTGEVDAKTGEVLAFYDAAHYASITGGVFPLRSTGQCDQGGCDFPHPMPFTNFVEDGEPTLFTDDFGFFECVSAADPVTTTLSGPYARIDETCGPVSETATCGESFFLGQKAGENCVVAPGASPGNTSAARTAFFHVNRVAQAARTYLPANAWLQNPVTINTNVNNTCNASWGGEINMFRGGNGCGNTGENLGVLVHEWGHGFDQNDGGGYDNTSEAYADTVALLYQRDGCIGWGFFTGGGTCSGYGDTCLECTGVRDMDYTRRQANQPATPQTFVDPRCGSGSGPCGRVVHCESYPITESILDLARIDLPAMGYDEASAWQLAERLWYESRTGSGGDIYTCALPNSDSCSSSSWYQGMRVADDDDGNLANGTPHAAALFAAFNRHGIACGAAADATNQNSGSCPSLPSPTLTAIAENGGVTLNWSEVPGAANYTIFRGDLGCNKQHINVGTAAAPATSFFDDNVDAGFIAYYRVRPNGANPACTGKVSNCIAIPDEAKLIQNGFRLEDNVVGDGDGRIEPGETFRLPVTLFNYGTQDAAQVIGSLISEQADRVRVIGPAASWPDITRNASFESNAPHFEVTVLPDANCGESLGFDLLASAQGVTPVAGSIGLQMGVFTKDYRNDTDFNIPNRTTTPVTSTIIVTDVRTIQELDVSVDISSFRSSDFVVEVRSPSGTTVRLHNQTNGSLNTRFDRDRQPDGPGTMAAFIGEPLNGTWTLSVSDNVSGPFPNGSTLRSWALHGTVNQPFDCTEFACGDALPAAVPPTMLVTKSGADLAFDWDGAVNADGYNVLSSTEPTLAGPAVAARSTSGAVTQATSAGAVGGPAGAVTYYKVRATNSCNWEGP